MSPPAAKLDLDLDLEPLTVDLKNLSSSSSASTIYIVNQNVVAEE